MSKLFSSSNKETAPSSPKEQFAETLAFILAVALAITVGIVSVRYAFGTDASPFFVSGDSMYPTLIDGQRVIINKTQEAPSGGDIIITMMPEAGYQFTTKKEAHHIVKRVIACPGETLEICADDVILVNGVPLEEPYLSAEAKMETYVPNYPAYYELSDGEYFVVGDNRANSCDSRYFGVVTSEEIVGIINENSKDASFIETASIKIIVCVIALYFLTERLLILLLRKALKV